MGENHVSAGATGNGDDMTEDELAQALANALEENIENRPPGFRTRRELQALTGHGKEWVLGRLHLLNNAGLLESREIPIKNLHGIYQGIWAYRLKEKP